jgi:hypothetical protein
MPEPLHVLETALYAADLDAADRVRAPSAASLPVPPSGAAANGYCRSAAAITAVSS